MKSSPPSLRAREAAGVMSGAAAVILCALLALTAWQYAMPPSFESSWRLNHASIDLFRGALGLSFFDVGEGTFRWFFRGLLLASWCGYFLMLFAGVYGGRLPRRPALAAMAGLAVALAVLWPASLSTDVYGYVGYGRIQVIHHANPYLTSQEELVRLGDPTAPFLRWGIRSPYGPLWTWLSAGAVWALGHASLWAEVVAMKLLSAAAVVAAAWAGGALAERLRPGTGDLALVAIGFNPLFLIEGAGNGHNDVVMMALVLGGLALAVRERAVVGALLIGLGAAVKFIPILAVPWMVLHAFRVEPRPVRRWVDAGLAFVVGVAPLLIAFAPLWAGGSTFDGLLERWSRGRFEEASDPAGLLLKNAWTLAAYLAASAWVVDKADPGRLVTGWMVASAGVLFGAAGVWLPWYLVWPWAASLCRWDARHVGASYLLFCLAVVFTLRYSMLLGGG